MAAEDLFIPAAPIDVPSRPLDKGIMRHVSSTMLEEGAVLTAKNFIVGSAGPLRRPGLAQVSGGATVYFPPVRGIVLMTLTSGTQQLLVFDERLLYLVGASSFTLKSWDYDTGTINCSAGSLTVSGIGTDFDDSNADLKVGDILKAGSGADLERIKIAAINGSLSITLEESMVNARTATAYDIYRSFKASNPYLVVWTVADNKIIFADSNRPLFAYDGSSFGDFDSSLTFAPSCVEFFNDRLWCGHIVNGSDDLRQRIIWSTTTDLTDFDVTGRYLDLSYQQGAVQRILGMGELLVAYFDDALYYGKTTNIAGDTLPVAFDRLETGGIGLVGQAAVTPFLDGHFFVGQDNIYFLSVKGFQPIGTPVVRQTIDVCENMWAVYAAVDARRDRVVFGFPDISSEMTKLWSYNYKARAWSYDEVACNAIAGMSRAESVSWDSLSGYTWDSPPYTTWEEARSESRKKFYIGKSGKIFELDEDATTDESNVNIPIELITGDMDDGVPNQVKTTTRLSIKIDQTLSNDLTFTVYWSVDRGATWNNAGNCTISAGEDEGYVNFLATGSTLRIKLTSDSAVVPYRIMELVRRTRGRGLEVHLGS